MRGAGRGHWAVGGAAVLGGLLLGGMPLGIMDEGSKAIDAAATAAGHGWVDVPIILGTGLTGAAVLRAALRIFAGVGRDPGEQATAPREQEREPSNRPVWLMLGPALLLLAGALISGDRVGVVARRIAGSFLMSAGLPDAHVPVLAAPHPFAPYVSLGLAVVIAASQLWRDRLPQVLVRVADRVSWPLFGAVPRLHTGRIGDYVTWIVVGLAMFTVVLALG